MHKNAEYVIDRYFKLMRAMGYQTIKGYCGETKAPINTLFCWKHKKRDPKLSNFCEELERLGWELTIRRKQDV